MRLSTVQFIGEDLGGSNCSVWPFNNRVRSILLYYIDQWSCRFPITVPYMLVSVFIDVSYIEVVKTMNNLRDQVHGRRYTPTQTSVTPMDCVTAGEGFGNLVCGDFVSCSGLRPELPQSFIRSVIHLQAIHTSYPLLIAFSFP